MRRDVTIAPFRGGEQDRSAPRDYHAYHDPHGTAKLSTTVVHAVADVAGIDVSGAERSLSESVDPAGLDRLFSTDGTGQWPVGHVAFTVNGYPVTVYSDGRIVVTPPATRPR